MKKRCGLWIACMLILAGCETWLPVEGEVTARVYNCKVTFPEGWKRFNRAKDAWVFTKDGIALQQIRISRMSVDEALPHTKRKFTRDMLPQEAAELIIQDLQANPEMMDPQVTENVPEQIGGRDGFKIVYTFHTKAGLKKKGICFGLVMDAWCYELRYEAAQRHYFLKDLPAFMQVKDSFRLIKIAS